MSVTSVGSDIDYDPYDYATVKDPYGALAELRRSCPVHVHSGDNPLVTVADHKLITRALTDHETFSSEQGPGPQRFDPSLAGLLLADDPRHGVLRRIVSKYYAPKLVERKFGPRIELIVDELIDAFYQRGQCEFMDEFGWPLSILVAGEILNFDLTPDDVRNLQDWQVGLLSTIGRVGEHEITLEDRAMEVSSMAGWLLERIARRRADLERGCAPDDPLTALVASDEQLSDMEIVPIVQQLMNTETSSAMLGHAMVLLASHASERDKLLRDPGLVENAVEEVLRMRAPVPGLCRTNKRKVELGDRVLEPDTKIRLMFGAANHDPELWDEADEFRVDRPLRDLRRHYTFGHGIHTCVGAPVARLEGRLALNGLLRRLGTFRLNSSPEHEDRLWVVHTYRTVNLAWDVI